MRIELWANHMGSTARRFENLGEPDGIENNEKTKYP
jgi:hypothetical protein